MGGLVADIGRWIVEVVYSFGYVGVAVLVGLGYLHLVVPTQLVLPLAGFLVGQGSFSFVPVLIWATVGGVVGSIILYFPGLWIGEESMRRFVGRYGRFVFVYESDLDKASDLFERHGGKAVLIGHLIPGVTALISIPAGMKRMSLYGRFLLYTTIGSALWNGAFIALGWALGANYKLIERYAPVVEWTVIAAIVGGIVWFLWRRRKAQSQ